MADKNFEQQERVNASRRRAQDREDFNQDMAGVDVGRMSRFGDNRERKRRARNTENERRSRLDILLMDAAYRAAYDNAMSALNGAEEAVYSAQLEAADTVASTRSALNDAIDQATTLPDGMKVFRSKDGSVYTEDGRKLNDKESAAIDWREGSPSWEDYLSLKLAHKRAEARYEQLARDNDRLAIIRVRMENEDDPPTPNELAGFRKEIEEIEQRTKPDYQPSSALKSDKPQQESEFIISLDGFAVR